MERLLVNYEKLEELASSEKGLRPIFSIDHDLLSNLVEFLKEVTKVFDDLEQKTPTIHLVLPRYYKLKNLCNDAPEIIKPFTDSFSDALTKKYKTSIKDEHYIATIMTPQFRGFNFVRGKEEKESERNKAVNLLRQVVPPSQKPISVEPQDKRTQKLIAIMGRMNKTRKRLKKEN